MAYNTFGGNSNPKIVKLKYVNFSNFSVISWNIIVEPIIISSSSSIVIIITAIIILSRSLFLLVVFEGLI